jgi:hypothetical protein
VVVGGGGGGSVVGVLFFNCILNLTLGTPKSNSDNFLGHILEEYA